MRQTREQIKAEMMKKYEQELDELLDWREKANEPNLTEFEEAILSSRKKISEEMVRAFIQGEYTREPESPPNCEKCGSVMEDKGKRAQTIETRLGTLQITRAYYYCNACREGFFPPG